MNKDKPVMPWANRIVGSGEMSPSELMKAANPNNPRMHPDYQADALEQVLDEVGFIDRVIFNRSTGRLIDGHLRVKMALQKGMASIPVEYVELNEAEEKLVLATFDSIAGLADFDVEKLAALSDDIALDFDMDLSDFFADDSGIDFGESAQDNSGEDTEPAIDRAAELQAEYKTELGQLWQLGEHRLIVGDCTDAAVIGRLMDGGRANLYLTDPPYAVSYADKNRFLNRLAKGNAIQKPIENDHLSLEEAQKMWFAAAKSALAYSFDTASYYWFACQGGDQMMMMMMMIDDAGWKVRHELIWVKNNHVLGRSDYQYKHEPILYGWKKNGTHKFFGGFQVSVLEFNKPLSSKLHPTTKPVELVECLIKNSTQNDETVLDTFVGSGTTIIACENLNRKCRAVEISPNYAAVSIHRWESHTGGKAELING